MHKRTKFGSVLKRVREGKGLSQKGLGERSDVHHITIARLEAGDVTPRAATVRLLAAALGVSAKALGASPTRRTSGAGK